MLQKSARVPSKPKWCGETFSHYFKDGTVLRCQITDTSFTNSPVCSSKRARRSVEESRANLNRM